MLKLSNFTESFKELILNNETDGKTFAEKIGLEGSTVTRYLNGERYPTVKNFVVIADYFKCSADFLLGEGTTYPVALKERPLFSEQFKKLLKVYGYSAFRLAKEMKIDQNTVYCWKSGKREPTLDNVIKLAEFFDCPVDFVLGRTN